MNGLRDIIYCIGSPESKRRFFRKSVSEEFVYADNDEVLASVSKNGCTYFLIGDMPFADMTVRQFVSYNGSIIRRGKTQREGLGAFLWKSCRTVILYKAAVKNMPRVAYRAMQCYALITEKTAEVALNFDGTEFSRRNMRNIRRLAGYLARRFRVMVSVADARFIPAGGTVRRFFESGEYLELSLSATARRLRRTAQSRKLFEGEYPGKARVRRVVAGY